MFLRVNKYTSNTEKKKSMIYELSYYYRIRVPIQFFSVLSTMFYFSFCLISNYYH